MTVFPSSITSGLDNAGKTTILKKFNGEDINTISPTLGFNVKTLEYKGLVGAAIVEEKEEEKLLLLQRLLYHR